MKTTASTIQQIPLKELKGSPTNPRKTFDPAKLKDLADSMKAGGQLQAALVRPWPKAGFKGYEVIAGERRLRAAAMAGLEVLRCEVKELDDRTVAEIQLVENVQRDDLQPMEEAEAYGRLIQDLKMKVDEIVQRTGKSRSYIMGRLGLLELSKDVRAALAADSIPLTYALELRRVARHEDQDHLLQRALGKAKGATSIDNLRELREHIEEDYLLELAHAAFDRTDAKLVPGRPACGPCTEHTAAQSDLFGDHKKKDVCLNAGCFKSKLEAHGKKLVEQAKEEKRRVLMGKEAEAFMVEARRNYGRYKDLDDGCYSYPGDSSPKYREVLKRHDPEHRVEVFIVLDDHGKVGEYVKSSDVDKILPKRPGQKGPSPAAAAREAAERQKKVLTNKGSRAAWAGLWPKVIERAEAKPFKGEHLRLVLSLAVAEHMDYKAGRGYTLRTEPGKKTNYDNHNRIAGLIRNAKTDEAALKIFYHVVLGDGLSFFQPSDLDRSTAKFVQALGFNWAQERTKGVAKVKAEKAAKQSGAPGDGKVRPGERPMAESIIAKRKAEGRYQPKDVNAEMLRIEKQNMRGGLGPKKSNKSKKVHKMTKKKKGGR
jgi:ParB/RepB/Spo0J family partition protein